METSVFPSSQAFILPRYPEQSRNSHVVRCLCLLHCHPDCAPYRGPRPLSRPRPPPWHCPMLMPMRTNWFSSLEHSPVRYHSVDSCLSKCANCCNESCGTCDCCGMCVNCGTCKCCCSNECSDCREGLHGSAAFTTPQGEFITTGARGGRILAALLTDVDIYTFQICRRIKFTLLVVTKVRAASILGGIVGDKETKEANKDETEDYSRYDADDVGTSFFVIVSASVGPIGF